MRQCMRMKLRVLTSVCAVCLMHISMHIHVNINVHVHMNMNGFMHIAMSTYIRVHMHHTTCANHYATCGMRHSACGMRHATRTHAYMMYIMYMHRARCTPVHGARRTVHTA